MENWLIGLGVMGIFALLVWLQNGIQDSARQYLVDRGYEVTHFKLDIFEMRCTNGGEERKSYSFRAIKDGKPVEGYLCYGGIAEAVIHVTG